MLLVLCDIGTRVHVFTVVDWNGDEAMDSKAMNLGFTCNFSLQYPYTIQQTGDEITQTYQLNVVIKI